jgi:hypothetical protein
MMPLDGAVAQLVERQLCKLDVVGSTPISSTKVQAGNSCPGAAAQHGRRTKHSDNRIRRVKKSIAQRGLRGVPTIPKGLDLDLELVAARAIGSGGLSSG